MNSLINKTAVITGGNNGIGYATAKEFISQWAKVIITWRKQEAVAKAAQELGVTGVVADQSNLQAIDQLVQEVKNKFWKIDILFINAGVFAWGTITETQEASYDNVMDINVKWAFFTLSKFIPVLNDGASVIFLSSTVATAGMPWASVYAASKAALNSIMRAASLELADKNIRVNSVSPGPIETNIFNASGFDAATIEHLKSGLSNMVPLKRMGRSEEVANMVSFLASDSASYITGSDFNVDGGANVNSLSL